MSITLKTSRLSAGHLIPPKIWATPAFTPNLDKQYREIDVIGVTQGWVNSTFPNYGLLLRSTTVDEDGDVRFRTREEDKPEEQPQLCITYAVPQADLIISKTAMSNPPVCKSSAARRSTTPRLSWATPSRLR
jgi:hypothetical protein